jgi:hypothetical protein
MGAHFCLSNPSGMLKKRNSPMPFYLFEFGQNVRDRACLIPRISSGEKT